MVLNYLSLISLQSLLLPVKFVSLMTRNLFVLVTTLEQNLKSFSEGCILRPQSSVSVPADCRILESGGRSIGEMTQVVCRASYCCILLDISHRFVFGAEFSIVWWGSKIRCDRNFVAMHSAYPSISFIHDDLVFSACMQVCMRTLIFWFCLVHCTIVRIILHHVIQLSFLILWYAQFEVLTSLVDKGFIKNIIK